jgi:hypothetical protein
MTVAQDDVRRAYAKISALLEEHVFARVPESAGARALRRAHSSMLYAAPEMQRVVLASRFVPALNDYLGGERPAWAQEMHAVLNTIFGVAAAQA